VNIWTNLFRSKKQRARKGIEQKLAWFGFRSLTMSIVVQLVQGGCGDRVGSVESCDVGRRGRGLLCPPTAHFRRRNTRSTDAEIGSSDNGDAHGRNLKGFAPPKFAKKKKPAGRCCDSLVIQCTFALSAIE
jgi:hypothetical protein